MDVLEELNNLTIWDASTLKNKKEIENVIDALTQAQYNYNREDVGMSAEDLATIFGKEKATKLEKNYQESYEQNYGRKINNDK
jgi:ABC-type Fe3+-hydroxamate transport system substrate-binding protein